MSALLTYSFCDSNAKEVTIFRTENSIIQMTKQFNWIISLRQELLSWARYKRYAGRYKW